MNGVINILREPMLERVGWTLVHSVWECSLAAILLAVVLVVMRRSGTRYIAACTALVACVLLPAGTFWLLGQAAPVRLAAPVPTLGAPSAILGGETSVQSLTAVRADPLDTALPIAALLWFVGVAVLSARHIAGWMSLRRLRNESRTITDASLSSRMQGLIERMKIRRAVTLAESALVQVPSLIGWLRPVVLMPCSALTGLSPLHLQALLAHELAHVRRNDYLVNLVQTAIETLLFYHPLVWWISRQVRQEREHCCDDLAVAMVGDAREYGAALAAMEQLRSPGDLAMASSGGSLLKRIRRLVRPEPRRSMVWPAVMVMAVVLGVAACSRVMTTGSEAMAQQPTTQPAREFWAQLQSQLSQPTTGPNFNPADWVDATPVQIEAAGFSIEQRRAIAQERARRASQRGPATTQAAAQPGDFPGLLALTYEELRDLSRAYTEATLRRMELEQTHVPGHPNVQRARANEDAIGRLYQEKLLKAMNQRQGPPVPGQAVISSMSFGADPPPPQGSAPAQLELQRSQDSRRANLVELLRRLAERIEALKAEGRAGDENVMETLNANLARVDEQLRAFDAETRAMVEAQQAPAPTYFIGGAPQSGMYYLGDSPTRLSDAIYRAGMHADWRGSNDPEKFVIVIVHRAPQEGLRSRIIRVSQAFRGGSMAELVIRPGDVLLVTDKSPPPLPPGSLYTVDGDVPTPGAKPWHENMTLLQAIVGAGVNPLDAPERLLEWQRPTRARVPEIIRTTTLGELLISPIGQEPVLAGDRLMVKRP